MWWLLDSQERNTLMLEVEWRVWRQFVYLEYRLNNEQDEQDELVLESDSVCTVVQIMH